MRRGKETRAERGGYALDGSRPRREIVRHHWRAVSVSDRCTRDRSTRKHRSLTLTARQTALGERLLAPPPLAFPQCFRLFLFAVTSASVKLMILE